MYFCCSMCKLLIWIWAQTIVCVTSFHESWYICLFSTLSFVSVYSGPSFLDRLRKRDDDDCIPLGPGYGEKYECRGLPTEKCCGNSVCFWEDGYSMATVSSFCLLICFWAKMSMATHVFQTLHLQFVRWAPMQLLTKPWIGASGSYHNWVLWGSMKAFNCSIMMRVVPVPASKVEAEAQAILVVAVLVAVAVITINTCSLPLCVAKVLRDML